MTVLLVVAKAPVPGAVKTRLCPPVSPLQAARIAAAALRDTLDAVRSTPGVTPVLACAGRMTDAEDAAGLVTSLRGWTVLPQRGSGLGDRLANAYAEVADVFPSRPVLQVGMDTPQLTPAGLTAAVLRLASADAVLGAAVDGGWWALGLREPREAELLRTVPMSTPRTGWLTWSALTERGLRVAPLPLLRDVDEWPDALAVAAEAPSGRFARQIGTVRRALVSGGRG
ncbi:TIGR04282 family arsenosugar biosynthesis glycosyltransferase [Micromonospora avicenniae]|uniref:TIGR04282 family arsenosugar biosynthesis glycosyltransferase n=1 Tax=Micromonospora avicenniae TaxID=1198245 RepID=UPI003323C7D9